MAFNIQTPQRPLPGAFLQTPALNRNQQEPISQPALFRQTSNPQPNVQTAVAPYNPKGAVQKPPFAPTLEPIERAARTINDTLIQETQYPELDSYVGRKILHSPTSSVLTCFQRGSRPITMLQDHRHGRHFK